MKVLISAGYGSGWSTWNYIELAFDPDIISAFENGATEEEMEALIISLGYESPYMGGYKQCKVEEVPAGTLFKIKEFDGAEYIEKASDQEWLIAQ